jgi:calcineurin-like phosphoesterase family protein
MTSFFTSDLHFGHEHILKYTKRGEHFTDINVHDEAIVASINKTVKETDVLYIIGDVSMHSKWRSAALIDQIVCHNKHLIFGNHDFAKREFYQYSGLFVSCQDLLEVKDHGSRIVMCHYPIAQWNAAQYGAFMLHGHCHGDFDYVAHDLDGYKIMDVGWDTRHTTGYQPYSLDEIQAIFKDRARMPHHGNAD